jgi:uncharacterized membrane protein (DUF485 family)
MIIFRILGSLIIMAIGVLMMKYTVRITDVIGKIDFAEKYLKSPLAGTYTWWRIVGFGAIVLGLLWMFGYLKFLPG